jgi:hypothetical protein
MTKMTLQEIKDRYFPNMTLEELRENPSLYCAAEINLPEEQPKVCECGGVMKWEALPDLGNTWHWWKCHDCGRSEYNGKST